MKLASVILDIPTQALDAPYTYAVPEEAGDQPIEVGCAVLVLSLIHISEPTRQAEISYAVFCLKKKKKTTQTKKKED